MIIVLLATATLTCFGTAYYLFTTRWASPPASPPFPFRPDAPTQVVARYDPAEALREFAPNEDDRFLGYLPHSGFHNQRIAFENALVLSRLLNRTLLVPPIRLGSKPLRYVKYDRLRQYLALSGKEGLHHCSRVPHIAIPGECTGYSDYTHVSWQWLVGLTEIKKNQKLLEVWNFTESWTYDNLGISERDTLTLRDENPYDYRFLDTPTDVSPPKDKYLEAVYLPALLDAPERLIQIGTLFGSSRLRLKQPENLLIRRDIRRSMAYSNPLLVDAANAIRDALGGKYLGAHVRVGDGHFKVDGQANARVVWWRLMNQVLGFGTAETLGMERDSSPAAALELPPPRLPVDLAARKVLHPQPVSLPKIFTPHISCRGTRHRLRRLLPLNAPLFISTDASDPLTDPSLQLFRLTFPCTFFLSDFATFTASLDGLRNEWDGVEMRDFAIPFLDAMVVGKAWAVVGTEGSTFSRFVEDVLWRTYHEWEIVQRG